MKRTVIINLLSVRAGGQITRAKAFLKRIRQFDSASRIIILQEASAAEFADYAKLELEVIRVALRARRFPAVQRMLWENALMPRLLERLGADAYVTFGHYLPISFPNGIRSVVGVSNLAPFSEAAHNVEDWPVRIKMLVQKQSILSSVRRASQVVALSETCRQLLIGHGVEKKSIAVVPNGVEISRCNITSADDLLQANSIVHPFLLYVSHFHRYKNHLRLVEAFARQAESAQAHYQLVLVGAAFNKAYFREVLATIDGLDMSERIRVVPGLRTEELAALYSRASAFVFPSLIENCPNILLEAMSFGLPILAADTAPMPEFCGEAAIYFNPLSVEDVREKIEYFAENAGNLGALGEKARERAAGYSWDRFTERLTALYLE